MGDPAAGRLRAARSGRGRRGDAGGPAAAGLHRPARGLGAAGAGVARAVAGRWPRDRAAANLRSALWRARRIGPLVQPGVSVLRLGPGCGSTWHELSASRGRPREALEGPPGAAGSTSSCCRTGPEDWVTFERERLRQVELQLLDDTVEAFVSRGPGRGGAGRRAAGDPAGAAAGVVPPGPDQDLPGVGQPVRGGVALPGVRGPAAGRARPGAGPRDDRAGPAVPLTAPAARRPDRRPPARGGAPAALSRSTAVVLPEPLALVSPSRPPASTMAQQSRPPCHHGPGAGHPAED